ncbi:Alpha/Beta hydrolase protein [Microdochium trichocladiopsis]|uniref:Alpha/Beta hydrolase protein n=1 Tax=Microdochium trichocladiopsis TaxID=1682393 RepID=A0A9P9BJN5_9PEZI|nr:Alpha/Beta hydrolase protein [Microdochium trichocladiopsis]KAH7025764.1 Alpha/Beta hydrolase protein [Microdochium trichocladiopsis]
MVYLKSTPEYTDTTAPFTPGPKNRHYSDPDPVWAGMVDAVETAMAPIWAPEVSISDFKQAWLASPLSLPANCPEPGKDVVISQSKFPARDGTEIGLQIYKAPNVKPDATLVYRIHSGGWVVCGHEVEEGENRSIGALGNVVVVSVDFRMAPEYKFPIPLEDCYDGLKWCKANADKLGINPEKIILVGNSGGANLTAVVALQARDEGLTGIKAVNLGFPATCHPKFFDQVPNKDNYELLSYRQNEKAGLVNTQRMEFFWDTYLREEDRKPDWRHSPLLSDNLGGLPPLRITASGCDPLRDEGIAFAEATKAAGNDVSLTVYGGLPHCIYFFPQAFKQVDEYYSTLLDFIRKYTD